MAIVTTLSKNQFIRQFEEVRQGQFSREALHWIFNYLDNFDGDVEFDPIAICCEWQESTVDEVIEAYDIEVEADAAPEDRMQAAIDYVDYHSVLLTSGTGPKSDSLVFLSF